MAWLQLHNQQMTQIQGTLFLTALTSRDVIPAPQPNPYENIVYGIANAINNVKEMGDFANNVNGFIGDTREFMKSHHVEVYDPKLRALRDVLGFLGVAFGSFVGGFVLARIFPRFPWTLRKENEFGNSASAVDYDKLRGMYDDKDLWGPDGQ